MNTRQSPVFRALLALLFAAGTLVQQQTALRGLLPGGGAGPDARAPLEAPRLTPGSALAPPASATARTVGETPAPPRAGSADGARGGIDLLFHARSAIHFVRARETLLEHRSFSDALRAAAQAAASVQTRAPPRHS
ncbi:MAG TPA: hypothetical protein VFZ69_08050 [Longimicrobiales bacterium]